ncbi:MAG TPA: tetratricopeptide repeat protein, partial [Thermoanaerobaculia bacterium]
LRATTEFDTAFQLASAQQTLGRVLQSSGLSDRAVPVLETAAAQWEALVAGKEADNTTAERGNFSAALGDLANALQSTGCLDEALATAERALDYDRKEGNDHGVAVGLCRYAQILVAQGRYAEADVCYDKALATARRVGDKVLEKSGLLSQGILSYHQRHFERATNLYKRALKLSQEMNDDHGVMRACNALGAVEQEHGRSNEARSWFERSFEIARQLGDVTSQAACLQNLGITCRIEGQAARREGHESKSRQSFEEAARLAAESLRLYRQLCNEPNSAGSLAHLARALLLLGELDEAERFANESREIHERLGLMEVFRNYDTLADIAHARGDGDKAAEWERKSNAVLQEQERRAQGPGGVPPQLLQDIRALSMACARAGFGQEQPEQLSPGEESDLAQIEQLAAPLSDIAPFLRRIAAGEIPSPPTTLPAELQELFTQLIDAIRESRGQS